MEADRMIRPFRYLILALTLLFAFNAWSLDHQPEDQVAAHKSTHNSTDRSPDRENVEFQLQALQRSRQAKSRIILREALERSYAELEQNRANASEFQRTF